MEWTRYDGGAIIVQAGTIEIVEIVEMSCLCRMIVALVDGALDDDARVDEIWWCRGIADDDGDSERLIE